MTESGLGSLQKKLKSLDSMQEDITSIKNSITFTQEKSIEVEKTARTALEETKN